MKKRILSLAATLLITSTVLAACGSGAQEQTNNSNQAAATGEVKEFTVKATNFAFEPVDIKVKKGDTVKITLENAEGMHGIAIPDFKVDIQGNKTAEFVADKAGEFTFACSIMCGSGHGEMTGKIIVEE